MYYSRVELLNLINSCFDDADEDNDREETQYGDEDDYLDISMDEETSCRLCGLNITHSKNRIYFYGEREIEHRFMCHSNCFRCSYCNSTLTLQNYFLSPRKNLLCWRHSDLENVIRHENILRELREFKDSSKDRLSIMRSGDFSSSMSFDQEDMGSEESTTCQCKRSTKVINNHGYWIECSEKSCPFQHTFNEFSHTKNFNVPHWEVRNQNNNEFSLQHYEEELYEVCFMNSEHFNYYTVDEHIGPIVLSLKQEQMDEKNYYRLLIRSSSHILSGLVPFSCFCSSNFNKQQVLDVVNKELKLTSSLRPFSHTPTPNKLCFLDKVMFKDEFKVGVVFINGGQVREEDFFTNTSHNVEFEEFLSLLGNQVELKGFKGYNGGLDTVYGLTGKHSLYKEWKNYKIMYHVSTMLPMEEHDDQKLQRKRHIGNDIVCIIFLASGAQFEPSSIKSNFLHVYIIIQPQLVYSVLHYKVTVVARDLVVPFGPPIPSSHLFKKDSIFQEWLMTKIINAERASYHSPKFSSMQERTRRQLLEEVVHEQACKELPISKPLRSPFQRFLPIRSSARSTTSSKKYSVSSMDKVSSSDQLQRDFKRAFTNDISHYHDVFFNVGADVPQLIPAVKAILAARSRVFSELLFPNDLQNSPLGRRSSMVSRTPSSHIALLRSHKRWSDLWKKQRSSSHDIPTSKSALEIDPHNNAVKSPSEFFVTEFEPDEFKALLEFIHTGSCMVHVEILAGLACTAEYYDVTDLVKICLDCCADLLTTYNACFVLSSLRKHSMKYNVAGIMQKMEKGTSQDVDVKNQTLEFIEEHAEKIFSSFDTSSLSEDCLLLTLSSDIRVNESTKYQAIKRWYHRINSIARYQEDGLSYLLSFVNLSRLSLDEQREAENYTAKDLTADADVDVLHV